MSESPGGTSALQLVFQPFSLPLDFTVFFSSWDTREWFDQNIWLGTAGPIILSWFVADSSVVGFWFEVVMVLFLKSPGLETDWVGLHIPDFLMFLYSHCFSVLPLHSHLLDRAPLLPHLGICNFRLLGCVLWHRLGKSNRGLWKSSPIFCSD